MAKQIGYKPAPANTNKGYKTHGSYNNRGGKAGISGAVGKEKLTPSDAPKVMSKILADLRKNRKKASTLSYYDNVTPKMSK